jgi:acetyltransferase
MGSQRSLRAVFEPRRVAVVGASEKPESPGEVIWKNLGSFPGEVLPVSRTSPMIGGQRAYASLRDIPGAVDLAVVAVPAAAALEVLRDAVAAGVGAVVLVSAGFAETGPSGVALQNQIVLTARAGGVLLVGPNCLGVQNCDLPLNASLASGMSGGRGGISLITQSGSYAMAVHSMSSEEGLGFAIAYSSGNRADIDDSEVLDYLREDDRTNVVCVFAESLGDGRAFLDAARRTTLFKPVIVAAVGQSEAGARAAASHTAALAADRRSWNDLLRGAGVTVVRSGIEMLDAARGLLDQPPPAGNRAAIITNSGGTGTELADLLADEGVVLPELSKGLRARLAELLPDYASTVNPVDITPVWSRFAELYPTVLDILARSGEVDLVIPVLLHRSAEDAAVAEGIKQTVERLRMDGIAVPVYVCWVARRSAWPVAAALQSAGIPCLEWPPRAARAVGHAVRYGEYLRLPPSKSSHPAAIAERAIPQSVGIDAEATYGFLVENGIPMIETIFATDLVGALAGARRVGYPVVLKVDHPKISHKTDVGGVRLNLMDDDAVNDAASTLMQLAPGARLMVQPMSTGIEVVIGGIREPTFGPVVVFGLGGVLVETIDDVRFAAAPLSAADAAILIRAPRGAAILGGVRGKSPSDVGALATLARAVGDLMAGYPDLLELDLNPVLVGQNGCVAADFRAVMAVTNKY